MILLWGILEDSPLAAVYEGLRHRRANMFLLDQRNDESTEICCEYSSGFRGGIRCGEASVDLDDIRAAYIRPHDGLRQATSSAANRQRQQVNAGRLLGWLDHAKIIVVNRPSAMASNNSKPFQQELIRAVGFRVPETLITNDEHELRAFRRQHRRVIYKSISGIRSIVSELSDDQADERPLAACPTQFQERIDGDDVRVHVVGDRTFGCTIRCPASDYRYAHRAKQEAVMSARRVPQRIAKRAVALTQSLGLVIAGLDFRVRGDDWFCFEANPSPGFTAYAPHADAVAKAICEVLDVGGLRSAERSATRLSR